MFYLRIIFSGLMMIGSILLAKGQTIKACYDEMDKPKDEAVANYCVVGKARAVVNRFDTRDTNWVFIDTVRAFYTSSKKIKFLKEYDQNGLAQGPFVEFYENGRIKQRGSYSSGELSGLLTRNYTEGKQHYTIEYFPIDQTITDHPSGNYRF